MTAPTIPPPLAEIRARDEFAYRVINESDRGYACEDVHELLQRLDVAIKFLQSVANNDDYYNGYQDSANDLLQELTK